MIRINENMKYLYEGTCFGVLAVSGFCPQAEANESFDRHAKEVLERNRNKAEGYERKAFIESDPVIAAYVKYYKKFKKSYHVLLQTESAMKGRELPDASPLIRTLLLTELETGTLIAAHDLDTAKPPFEIFCAEGGESYIGAGERDVTLKPNDISMRDKEGVILSIIYGQDHRTRITDSTQNFFFLIDGVPGISKKQMSDVLDTLLDNLMLYDTKVRVEEKSVLSC